LLVDSGADVNIVGGPYRQTPLHEVAYKQNLEIYNYLLSVNADENIKNSDGDTPPKLLSYYNSQNVAARSQESIAEKEKERLAKAKSEGVHIGMTQEEVRNSNWVSPTSINNLNSHSFITMRAYQCSDSE
jgi:flagellar biosynthesis/type III secretory pathway protein FliH